ncbi:fluoride efflux transporter CrcB [Ectobacillus polymachus]|uniref:fluoride efflux transporter CrcB n=1 Tax=Ectobacillus polymachus TaxID=1508806 RepID=UPI003A892188
MDIILVATGGFFGAIARFMIGNIIKVYYKGNIPYATLCINLLGAFLLGMLLGMHVQHAWYLLLGTGFMGAFTTFSTFKLESILLWENSKMITIVYVMLSYVAGISLAFAGFMTGTMIN